MYGMSSGMTAAVLIVGIISWAAYCIVEKIIEFKSKNEKAQWLNEK